VTGAATATVVTRLQSIPVQAQILGIANIGDVLTFDGARWVARPLPETPSPSGIQWDDATGGTTWDASLGGTTWTA
jgi:hypothetical protein